MRKLTFLLALLVCFLQTTAANLLTAEDINIQPGETKTVTVSLENSTAFSAFQLDIVLPDGISIGVNKKGKPVVTLDEDRVDDQTVSTNFRNANTVAVSALSLTSSDFYENSGPLFSFDITAASTFSGSAQLAFKNIVFFESSGAQEDLPDAGCTLSSVVAVTQVVINQPTLELAEGDSALLVATVAPDNATDKTVTWTSSNTAIATVDANGKVTAVAPGSATITAKCGTVSATCAVTVKTKVIPVTGVTLDKTSIELVEGDSMTLVATVAPANATDKTVTWTSSNSAIATVDANGKVIAVAPGNATITAKCGTVSATCSVTVKGNGIAVTAIKLDKTYLELVEGSSATLVATVTPANATDKTVKWTSSNTSIAIVDADGKVSAFTPGNATITAKCGTVSAICEVRVIEDGTFSVSLNHESLTIYTGHNAELIATCTSPASLSWTSSNAKVASVVDGKITAKIPGEADITVIATELLETEPSSHTSVLNNANFQIPNSGSTQYADYSYTDGNYEYNANVCTTSPYGKVLQIRQKNGSCIVTSKSNGIAKSIKLDWLEATNTEGLPVNNNRQILVYGSNSPYSISDFGEAKAYGELITQIDYPSSETVNLSGNYKYIALKSKNGSLYLNSATIVWEDVKTITQPSISQKVCHVTVVPVEAESITLNKNKITLNVGGSEQLTATLSPADTYNKTITWTSSNSAIATVDANGKITAVALGNATITAKCGTVSATCEVTVTAPLATEVTATYIGDPVLDQQDIYGGISRDFVFEIKSNGRWNEKVSLFLYQNDNIVAQSESQNISFEKASTQTTSWSLTIPVKLAGGMYSVGLGYIGENGETVFIPNSIDIEVKNPYVIVTNITVSENSCLDSTELSPAIMISEKPEIGVTLEAHNGTYSNRIKLVFQDEDLNVLSVTNPIPVEIGNGESETYTFQAPSTLTVDTIYCFTVVNDDNQQISNPVYFYFDYSTAVNCMNEGEDLDYEYYDLTGNRIKNPDTGIYIVRKGSQVSKQLIQR